MLCDISMEEAMWAEVTQSIQSAGHVLNKALGISTITSVFKRNLIIDKTSTSTSTPTPDDDETILPPPKSVNLADFMTFLTDTEKSPDIITACMTLHMGQRYPIHIKVPGDGAAASKNPKKALGDFYNQMTLSIKDGTSTKSIKIFNNLTLHVTGCKSPYEGRVVATLAWDLLSKVYPFVRDERYTQSIQMINATSEVNYSFNLKNLSARLRQHASSILDVKYDPMESDYPGALAKVSIPNSFADSAGTKGKHVTVMIFASGNLAFSARSLSDIAYAYTVMVGFFADSKTIIQSKEPILSKKRLEETTKKRKYTLRGPRKNAKKINAIIV